MARTETGVVDGGGYLIDGASVPRVTDIVALARLRAPWETEPATAAELARLLAQRGPMGTHIHAVTAAYPDPVVCPPEVCTGECRAYRDQFGLFVDAYRPMFLHREMPVFSRTHAYAGRLDWIAVIGDRVLVGDTKTGAAHPQVALQLAGYRYAEFTLDADGTEVPVPRCSGGVVLSLWPDQFELRDVQCDEAVFHAFLKLRSFHGYRHTLEACAIGAPHHIT